MSFDYRPFRGFNTDDRVCVYEGHLPHWRQPDCSYFVTFRLADSIPKGVLQQWEEEREIWYQAWGLTKAMNKQEWHGKYFSIPEKTRLNFERDQMRKPLMELDRCHGACIFRNQINAEILRKSLHHFDGERLQCGDYVIMPNHVHWIIMPLAGHELEGLLKSIKGFVSRELGVKDQSLKGSLWQKETYDRCIRDREELERTRTYIENNPHVAKLCAGEFIHWRAPWLNYTPEKT